jgi:hypothetical protein
LLAGEDGAPAPVVEARRVFAPIPGDAVTRLDPAVEAVRPVLTPEQVHDRCLALFKRATGRLYRIAMGTEVLTREVYDKATQRVLTVTDKPSLYASLRAIDLLGKYAGLTKVTVLETERNPVHRLAQILGVPEDEVQAALGFVGAEVAGGDVDGESDDGV